MSWLRRLLPPGARPATDDGLGTGVWRRAHDRFVRSVDRFAAVNDAVPHAGLAPSLAALRAAQGTVRELCARAQTCAPSAGLDLPGADGGRWLDVHRDLSRAATACAQACEAATMLRVAMVSGAASNPDAVRRAVEATAGAVERARARARADDAD